MNSLVSVGAVVVTHNSAATLPVCLMSLERAGCQPIVVVDNHSTDQTTVLAGGFPVQLVGNDQNIGFAAACNQGVNQLTTPYVLLLNPDAQLTPSAVALAQQYLVDHPAVGVIGFYLCDRFGAPQQDSFGDEVTPWSLLTRKLQRQQRVTKPRRCGWVSGGAMLLRREAFTAVRGFDEQFFLYWEDVDLCRRLRAAGWDVVFLPSAKVLHHRGASSADAREKTAQYDQSADRYFEKHYSTMICRLHRFWRRLYRFLVPLAR